MRARKLKIKQKNRKKKQEEKLAPLSSGNTPIKRNFKVKNAGKIQKLATRIAKNRVDEQLLSSTGKTPAVTAKVYGSSVRLKGETKAKFNGGSFQTENVVVTRGEGCKGCSSRQCLHATGTLVVNYRVTTQVKLPGVSSYPNLTPCQKKRVQDAITNVLAPHEQNHVRAFNQYNGTTRNNFEFTLCRDKFDQKIRDMVSREETARRSSAQAASDALDPFFLMLI